MSKLENDGSGTEISPVKVVGKGLGVAHEGLPLDKNTTSNNISSGDSFVTAVKSEPPIFGQLVSYATLAITFAPSTLGGGVGRSS